MNTAIKMSLQESTLHLVTHVLFVEACLTLTLVSCVTIVYFYE